MSLLTDLDTLPPFLVYATARKGHKQRKKLAEFVAESGLSERTFVRIARMASWRTVRIDQADRFCVACGADIIRSAGIRDYIRKTLQRGDSAFTHLLPRQKRRLGAQLAQIQTFDKVADYGMVPV